MKPNRTQKPTAFGFLVSEMRNKNDSFANKFEQKSHIAILTTGFVDVIIKK